MSDLPPPPAENKLTSEHFEEFKEALEIFYILANISGRVKFTQAWPVAAEHVLGAELIGYDEEGAPDRERRTELEQEAEERRLELLSFMETVEEDSVQQGALQVDFVKGAIEKMGRPIALLIYGQKIVDRFIPPLAGEGDAAGGAAAPGPQAAGSAYEVEKTPSAPEVKPIETAPPSTDEALSPLSQEAPKLPNAGVPDGASLDSLDDIKPIDMMPAPGSPPTAPQVEDMQQPEPEPREPEVQDIAPSPEVSPVAPQIQNMQQSEAPPQQVPPLTAPREEPLAQDSPSQIQEPAPRVPSFEASDGPAAQPVETSSPVLDPSAPAGGGGPEIILTAGQQPPSPNQEPQVHQPAPVESPTPSLTSPTVSPGSPPMTFVPGKEGKDDADKDKEPPPEDGQGQS